MRRLLRPRTTLLGDGLQAERGQHVRCKLAEALPVGLEGAAKALIEAANEAGGADNVTVVLARIREG